MNTIQTSTCRFIQGYQAQMLDYIQTPTYNGGVSVPLPEYMGKTLTASIGKLAIDKVTGIPVVVMPYVDANGVSGLLETEDQRLIFRALKDAGLPQEFLHDAVARTGKVLAALEDTSEIIVAGSIGTFASTPTMDVAAHGELTFVRGGQLDIDNSMKYIYNELASINGVMDSQMTDIPTARMLFRSGLEKASEALNPLKGNGLQVMMRRQVALDSLLLFKFNKDPQGFLNMVQEFLVATQQNYASNPAYQTQTMLTAKTADKLLADRSVLAKAVEEEAEMQAQFFLNKVNAPKMVNQIDEAFVLELINSLTNPDIPSFTKDTMNIEGLLVNGISAGAKMVSMLNKTAKGSFNTINSKEWFLPTDHNPLQHSESLTVNKVFSWLGTKTGMDTTQLSFNYFAEHQPAFVTGQNKDTIYGLPQAIPQTMDQLLFGIPAANNGVPDVVNPTGINNALSEALGKLANKAGVVQPGIVNPSNPVNTFVFNPTPQIPQNILNTQFGQPQQTFVAQPAANPFPATTPAAPNLIDQYNKAMHGYGQPQAQQPQFTMPQNNINQGGNNMFINQPNQQLIDVLLSADSTQLYVVNPARQVQTPQGIAVEIYNKQQGILAAYALGNGTALNMQGVPIGTVSIYQAPQAQAQFNMPAQFGAGMPVQPQGTYNYGQTPNSMQQPQFTAQPQMNPFAVPQMQAQPQFGGFNMQPQFTAAPQFTMPQMQAQPQFGGFQAIGQQPELRPNPLFGYGNKVMQFI